MTTADEFSRPGMGRPPRGVADILNDILNQATRLVRQEVALARTEASDKMRQAGVALGLIGAGAVLLIPALVVLLQAAVAALIDGGFTPAMAALIVGGGSLLIGAVLALIGVNRLKPANLVPERTIGQLQRDVEVAKEQIR